MALWRCNNARCSDGTSGVPAFDFDDKVPVCPKCGADGREPRMRRFISRRLTIHFDPPHPKFAGMGMNHAFCDENITLPLPRFHQLTSEPSAVNCVACQARMTQEDFPAAYEDEYVGSRVPPWIVGKEMKPKVPLGTPRGK